MKEHDRNVLFSSSSTECETPQDFFRGLDRIYYFNLDAAATPENTKCEHFFTKEDDALKQRWSGYGSVWCNPPYGREIGAFVEKAYQEGRAGTLVVMLLPARTDTKWWHDYVMKAREIYFVKGRLKFSGSANSAPFPSAVAVFYNDAPPHGPRIYSMNKQGKPLGRRMNESLV